MALTLKLHGHLFIINDRCFVVSDLSFPHWPELLNRRIRIQYFRRYGYLFSIWDLPLLQNTQVYVSCSVTACLFCVQWRSQYSYWYWIIIGCRVYMLLKFGIFSGGSRFSFWARGRTFGQVNKWCWENILWCKIRRTFLTPEPAVMVHSQKPILCSIKRLWCMLERDGLRRGWVNLQDSDDALFQRIDAWTREGSSQ